MSQQIPVGSVLGGRYEITAHIIITAESDMVLEGTDQILNRKVSVVVASPSRSALLEANSRALATNARGNIQILDLGITPEAAATSSPPTPAPTPCWTPCWSKTTHSPTQKTRWAPKSSATPKAAAPPNTYEKVSTSTANQESITAAKNWNASDGTAVTAYSEPTSIYEDDEDEEDGSRGTWAVALAAVLLLVIVAGGILTSLGAIGSNQAAAPHTPKSSMSASESAAANASASASPTAKASNAPAKIASVARFVPSNPRS